MSQPVAVSTRPAGLKRAGHDQSPVPAITPRLHAISAVAPRFVHKSVHNTARIRSQRGKEQVQQPACHGREPELVIRIDAVPEWPKSAIPYSPT